MTVKYILAIDQGTTSTRSIVFDENFNLCTQSAKPLQQYFPASGWVEHDPEEILQSTLETYHQATAKLGPPAAIGITNQRETVVVWDKATGKSVAKAIVWQDKRTAGQCAKMVASGLQKITIAKSGLLLEPYFSATKLQWLLKNLPGLAQKAANGEVCFGTVDSFLIWHLSGGKAHVTDATNASRTLLYDLHKGAWDEELLDIFEIPAAILPEVKDSSGIFAVSDPSVLGSKIPIAGVAGDQQAALVGQACFEVGQVKATYGTGCFALLNTGTKAFVSKNRLLTTVAYQIGGQRHYALEGSIYIAGAVLQWLRDGLKIIKTAPESNQQVLSANPDSEVVLVPAFVGLGAPYWNNECRGAIYNLTRATTSADIVKAALESVCFQTYDLIAAMRADVGDLGNTRLRVDGGMSLSDWTMQQMANLLGVEVDRLQISETTALGAAYLAGLAVGIYPDFAGFAKLWALQRRFSPQVKPEQLKDKLRLWQKAIEKTLL